MIYKFKKNQGFPDGVALDKAAFDRLDVTEVETVTILKDAASAAVYGARAANGVVLVTTKKGKLGAPVLNFTTNIGTTAPVNQPKLTSAYEKSLLINVCTICSGSSVSNEVINKDSWDIINKEVSSQLMLYGKIKLLF